MSTSEVARVLGKSVPTVTRLARAGALPVLYKAPGARGPYVFDAAAIDALLTEERASRSGRTPPRPAAGR